MTEPERILEEQRKCRDYIASDGPDQQGAWAGLADWVAEEIELCLENR